MDTPARVSTKKTPSGDAPVQSQKPVHPTNQNSEANILRNDLMSIIQSVQELPKPDKTGPVVCFGNMSLPILIAPLSLEEGDSTGVTLPVIAISHEESGRACAIGNTNILLYCKKEKQDASTFLESLVKWASGVTRGRIAITILGYSQVDTEILQQNLKSLRNQYFELRYAKKFNSLGDIQRKIDQVVKKLENMNDN